MQMRTYCSISSFKANGTNGRYINQGAWLDEYYLPLLVLNVSLCFMNYPQLLIAVITDWFPKMIQEKISRK